LSRLVWFAGAKKITVLGMQTDDFTWASEKLKALLRKLQWLAGMGIWL